MLLDELTARLTAMPEAERKEVVKTVVAATKDQKWFPNPGPQTDGYFSKADETFYGGQAGGGKTDLAVGLALTAHKRSLILRRINKDAVKIVSRIETILGTRDGYNGQLQRWRLGKDQQIDVAGCEQEADKQRFKGDPHDLIVFDEGTDFLESQYRFIIGWNRSAVPNQRCRVLVTSNPPTTAGGLWVIKYWAPWLDPTHPNPAEPGELRWFTTIGGKDVEVDGPGPHVVPGESEPVRARSRTFIKASVSDNPDLDKKEIQHADGTIEIVKGDYHSVLASLPDELRRAYRDGDFSVGLKDADFQVIPTSWIVAAQNRWTAQQPVGAAMTAIGLDLAGGGADETILAPRFGGWYAPMIAGGEVDASKPSDVAGFVVKHRRDRCPVVIDMGGGWGGGVKERLEENNVDIAPFNGANSSSAKTKDGQLGFINKRAEAYWKFREELDPEQEGGSAICLPPDAQLRSDLAAATWKLTPRGIQIESKIEIKKRLGRSPDRADAVVMALAPGTQKQMQMRRTHSAPPRVVMGHQAARRRH